MFACEQCSVTWSKGAFYRIFILPNTVVVIQSCRVLMMKTSVELACISSALCMCVARPRLVCKYYYFCDSLNNVCDRFLPA